VRFAVSREGPVRLTVYDVTGRRVANLVDGILGGGEHSTVWDGIDASGRRVASGVYLYRLQAAGESLTKEMVLTR
jgi:flagellar hook assembly protein FlgD